jgi:Protein of unknown function (DUF1566)
MVTGFNNKQSTLGLFVAFTALLSACGGSPSSDAGLGIGSGAVAEQPPPLVVAPPEVVPPPVVIPPEVVPPPVVIPPVVVPPPVVIPPVVVPPPVVIPPVVVPPPVVIPPVVVPPPVVIAQPSSTGKINDSGVPSSACYEAGSDALVSCSSVGALALNPAQDGGTGRDSSPATNGAADGKLGFSYTKIGSTGEELAASETAWSCVKDNITGLIWEVKTADAGLRDFNNQYTNLDGTTPNQLGNPVLPATANEPTAAQISASGNSVGFVNAVNTQTLCGASNWRLPTASELQGIVDYSVAEPGPAIDTVWFGNTATVVQHWTSTQLPFSLEGNARTVSFLRGSTGSASRSVSLRFIRLVRSS